MKAGTSKSFAERLGRFQKGNKTVATEKRKRKKKKRTKKNGWEKLKKEAECLLSMALCVTTALRLSPKKKEKDACEDSHLQVQELFTEVDIPDSEKEETVKMVKFCIRRKIAQGKPGRRSLSMPFTFRQFKAVFADLIQIHGSKSTFRATLLGREIKESLTDILGNGWSSVKMKNGTRKCVALTTTSRTGSAMKFQFSITLRKLKLRDFDSTSCPEEQYFLFIKFNVASY